MRSPVATGVLSTEGEMRVFRVDKDDYFLSTLATQSFTVVQNLSIVLLRQIMSAHHADHLTFIPVFMISCSLQKAKLLPGVVTPIVYLSGVLINLLFMLYKSKGMLYTGYKRWRKDPTAMESHSGRIEHDAFLVAEIVTEELTETLIPVTLVCDTILSERCLAGSCWISPGNCALRQVLIICIELWRMYVAPARSSFETTYMSSESVRRGELVDGHKFVEANLIRLGQALSSLLVLILFGCIFESWDLLLHRDDKLLHQPEQTEVGAEEPAGGSGGGRCQDESCNAPYTRANVIRPTFLGVLTGILRYHSFLWAVSIVTMTTYAVNMDNFTWAFDVRWRPSPR